MSRSAIALVAMFALALAGCANGSGVAPASGAGPGAPSAAASSAPLDRDQTTLLDATRQIAAKLLTQLGAFPPLALALDAKGKPVLVSNDVDPSFSTTKKIELLVVKLRALAARHAIRAVGIIVNGEIAGQDEKRQDAVLLSIEERGAPPLGFAVAYEFRGTGKRVAFADPKPLRARAQVFPAS